jgi:hypothetical protein
MVVQKFFPIKQVEQKNNVLVWRRLWVMLVKEMQLLFGDWID